MEVKIDNQQCDENLTHYVHKQKKCCTWKKACICSNVAWSCVIVATAITSTVLFMKHYLSWTSHP